MIWNWRWHNHEYLRNSYHFTVSLQRLPCLCCCFGSSWTLQVVLVCGERSHSSKNSFEFKKKIEFSKKMKGEPKTKANWQWVLREQEKQKQNKRQKYNENSNRVFFGLQTQPKHQTVNEKEEDDKEEEPNPDFFLREWRLHSSSFSTTISTNRGRGGEPL